MEVRKGYKKTDMGIVPEDWLVEPFQNFFSFISYGFTNPMPTAQSGIYMVTAKDINNGKLQFDTARFTTEEAYRTLLTDKSRPKKGDLLLTKDGALGRVALVDDRVICINQSVAIIRLNNKAVPGFIKVLLESPVYQQRMLEDAGGTTIKHIYITIVDKMPIVLPPTHAEQEAIAEALSDADALIESLETLLAKKRQVKQGAMSELLSGKRRVVESGEWEETSLGELGKIYRGVSYNPSNDLSPSDTDTTIRLLRSNNIQESTVVFSDMQYVDFGKVSNEQIMRKNDVLICMANGSKSLVGKAGRFSNEDGYKYTFGAFMGCFRPNVQAVNPDFSFYLFLTEQYRSHIAILLAGSSINNLTPSNVEAFTIKIPVDLAEQTAIAEILSDMDAEIRAVEEKLSKARAVKAGMMSELLTGRVRLV